MTDAERAELKRRAELANGTPVISDGPIWRDFRRAANPAAVLDLLKEHEEDQGVIAVWRGRTHRAEAEVERLRDLLRRAAGVFRDMAGMPMEADLLEAQVEDT